MMLWAVIGLYQLEKKKSELFVFIMFHHPPNY